MQDFKGRTVKEGDVLLLTYNNYNTMEIATIIDDKVRALSTLHRAPSSYTIYLLENPTANEVKEKDEIISEFNKLKAERAKKKKQKKNYGNMLGGVYSTTNGNLYIYLGNLHVMDYSENGELIDEARGNCYLYIGTHWKYDKDKSAIDKITAQDIFTKNSYLSCLADFNKGYKTVDGLYAIHSRFKMADYQDILGTYEYTGYSYYGNAGKKYRRVVELNTEA